ncbi:MAG TPA: hypothetical protein VFI94_10185 [Pseudolabrys sp.]|nr:hypothetical protein [Pseudolabrys sp.]
MGEPTRPADFAGGGNGTRLTLDFQWWGDELRPTHHRVVIGIQLITNSEDHVRGLTEMVSQAMPIVLEGAGPGPKLGGKMKAVLAHMEREQREADQEAENRKSGDYDPVFLEISPVAADIQFYKGVKAPKFRPQHQHTAPLGDAYSHDSDWVPELYKTIASGARRYDDELGAIAGGCRKGAAVSESTRDRNSRLDDQSERPQPDSGMPEVPVVGHLVYARRRREHRFVASVPVDPGMLND